MWKVMLIFLKPMLPPRKLQLPAPQRPANLGISCNRRSTKRHRRGTTAIYAIDSTISRP